MSISAIEGAPGALRLGWGAGAVATSPWIGNGFWRTMGGDLGGCGLG